MKTPKETLLPLRIDDIQDFETLKEFLKRVVEYLEEEHTNVYEDLKRLFQVTDEETAIKVKIGSFTCPAATGNYSVTGIPFKPRCIEFFVGRDESDTIYECFGRIDYTGNQHVLSSGSKDDRQRSMVETNKCLFVIDGLGDALLSATYISMNDDGCTINFAIVDTSFTILWKAVR